VALDDVYSVAEGGTLSVDAASGVLANDTDPEGDPLTAGLASNVSNGTLTLNADGSFTYTPNPGFEGSDSFIYVANDGDFNSNPTTVAITVIPAPCTLALSLSYASSTLTLEFEVGTLEPAPWSRLTWT
jgi:hypothetical protein